MQPHIFISSHVCPSLARSLACSLARSVKNECIVALLDLVLFRLHSCFLTLFLFSHLVFTLFFHIVLSPCLFTLFLSFHLILVLFLSYSCLSSVCMFLNLLSHIPLLSSVRTVVHNANSILLTTKEPNSSKMMTMDLWLILIIALLIIIICLLCHITKIKAEEEG